MRQEGSRKESGRTSLPARLFRRVISVCGFALVAGGVVLAGCAMPTKAMKQVKRPRAGRAIGGRVAIVYCKHYQLNLLGFERMHLFDIHKYARIYEQLVADRLLSPDDVFVPKEISRRDVLRVHTPGFLSSLRDPVAVAPGMSSTQASGGP